jgi:Protein of unknown function (DUF2541)
MFSNPMDYSSIDYWLTIKVKQVMTMLSLSQKVGISVVMMATLAYPLVAQARPPEGHLLGKTQLSYIENDRDVIQLGQCQPNQRISSLKVAVVKGTANIKLLRVRFGNNQREDLLVRTRINQGAQTRWIDLNGNKRCVTAITVVGDTTKGSPQPATVQVYGQ